jgi:hypothetical protein
MTRMAEPRASSVQSSSPLANPSWLCTKTVVDAGVFGAVSAVLVVPAGDMGVCAGGRGGLMGDDVGLSLE